MSLGRLPGGLAAVVLAATLAGCVPFQGPPLPPGEDPVDGNRGTVTAPPGAKIEGEPNDSFAEAILAVFDTDNVARLEGTVTQTGDIDVYELGPLSRGTRLVVEATSPASALDVSVALFDGERRLVHANDDRVDLPRTAEDLDSFIDFVIRHDGDPYYLAVTNSAFAATGEKTGAYLADLSLFPGAQVPPPVGQTLLLEFGGGVLNSPTLGERIIDPFSATSIDPIYAGRDADFRRIIREVVEQNFMAYDVAVFTSDDLPLPAGLEYSTIYLGGFNPGAFGIAETVDLYNRDFCDDAIIYTETFQPHIFSRTPTVAEMSVAIGNVTTHEAGHLLGLNHVDDDRAIMDDRSAADAFIEDQEFMEAPMSSDIIPLGTQDAPLLLLETVGPAEPAAQSRRWYPIGAN